MRSYSDVQSPLSRSWNTWQVSWCLNWSHDSRLASHDPRLESHDLRLRPHDPRLESHDLRLTSHDLRFESHDLRLSHLIGSLHPTECTDIIMEDAKSLECRCIMITF